MATSSPLPVVFAKVTGIHFPPLFPWLGVYARISRAPDEIGSDPFAACTVTMAQWTDQPVVQTGAASYRVPSDPTGIATASCSQQFANAVDNIDNHQGVRLFRLTSKKAYTGSITVTLQGVGTPNGLDVILNFYGMRLIQQSMISFTDAGTAINVPVLSTLGAISYHLPNSGPLPSRTDSFSFTAP